MKKVYEFVKKAGEYEYNIWVCLCSDVVDAIFPELQDLEKKRKIWVTVSDKKLQGFHRFVVTGRGIKMAGVRGWSDTEGFSIVNSDGCIDLNCATIDQLLRDFSGKKILYFKIQYEK